MEDLVETERSHQLIPHIWTSYDVHCRPTALSLVWRGRRSENREQRNQIVPCLSIHSSLLRQTRTYCYSVLYSVHLTLTSP